MFFDSFSYFFNSKLAFLPSKETFIERLRLCLVHKKILKISYLGNITKIKFPTKDNDLYEPVEFKNGKVVNKDEYANKYQV